MATILPNRARITYSSGGVSDTVLSNQTNTTLIDQYTIELTKTAVADEVRAGGDAVYIVRLENNGIGSLSSVTFTDDLGGESKPLTYAEGSAKFFLNGSPVTGTAEIQNGDLVLTPSQPIAAGDNLIVIYTARTGENLTGSITNTVMADASAGSQTEAAVTATASETISVTDFANVSVFKAADKDTVVSGDTLTYTFTLMNTGLEEANSIIFTDAFPEEFTVQSVSYTENGTETPISAADYTIEDPNTLVIPAEGSNLTLTVPAATAEGPGILIITVTGTIA